MACPDSFFFGGGCWAGCYHIGVYKALYEKWGDELYTKKFGGNSAGALIALGIVLRKTSKEIEDMMLIISTKSRKYGMLTNSFYIDYVLNTWLSDANDYHKLNNKLQIGITIFFDKFELIDKWNNNQEVIDTIHASMHIPFYTTHINNVNGHIAIDGGFSKDVYKLDENTFTISLFNDNACLFPSKKLNFFKCLFPASKEICLKIIKMGYDDTNQYDFNNIQYHNHTNYLKTDYFVQTAIAIAWVARISEIIIYKNKAALLSCWLLFYHYKNRNNNYIIKLIKYIIASQVGHILSFSKL